MFDLSYENMNIIETSCVINYDLSYFGAALKESQSDIFQAISRFDNARKILITEGTDECQMQLFTESAIDNIKKRFVKLFNIIIEFIKNRQKDIQNAVRTFINKNKADMTEVIAKVKQYQADGKYKNGPTVQMHHYTLSNVDMKNIFHAFHACIKTDEYNFATYTGGFINDAMVQKMKIENDAYKGNYDFKYTILTNLCSKKPEDNKDAEYYNTFVYELLRDGGETNAVNFDEYFDSSIESLILKSSQLETSYTLVFDNSMKYVREVEGQVNESMKYLKEDDPDFSVMSKYFNNKMDIVSKFIHTVVGINDQVLKAFIDKTNEAKRFCMMAYNYKASNK